jgi:hypothetical protein
MNKDKLELFKIICDSIYELDSTRSKGCPDCIAANMTKHFKEIINKNLKEYPDKEQVRRLNILLFDSLNVDAMLIEMMNSIYNIESVLGFITNDFN